MPTELIAAFRATLEEVLSADILLHVRDIAHEDSGAQKADVESVLKSLFGKEANLDHMIEVHNKVDQWRADHNGESYVPQGGALALSAVTGEGCDALLDAIDQTLSANLLASYDFRIPHADGRAIAWLYANGKVMEHRETEKHAHYRVRMSAANAARFSQQFHY